MLWARWSAVAVLLAWLKLGARCSWRLAPAQRRVSHVGRWFSLFSFTHKYLPERSHRRRARCRSEALLTRLATAVLRRNKLSHSCWQKNGYLSHYSACLNFWTFICMRVVEKLLKHAAASVYMQAKKEKKTRKGLYINIYIATRFLLRRCFREKGR